MAWFGVQEEFWHQGLGVGCTPVALEEMEKGDFRKVDVSRSTWTSSVDMVYLLANDDILRQDAYSSYLFLKIFVYVVP